MISDSATCRNIAANLRRILDERELNQSDLSRMTGDPVMTISRLCRGRNVPKVGVVARAAEALDVSIDRLTGPPPRKFPEKTLAGIDTPVPSVVNSHPST